MPSPTILLALALALALAGDALLAKLYVGAKQEVARVQQAYDSFKAQVKFEGEKAEADAKAHIMTDKLAKDTADAENKVTTAAHAAAIAELRHQRDSARSSFLSSTAATASSPDVACFDRPVYLGAYGSLVTGLRGLADEGAKAVTDLDTARKWARP